MLMLMQAVTYSRGRETHLADSGKAAAVVVLAQAMVLCAVRLR